VFLQQITSFNKLCNKVLEKVKNARINWHAEASQTHSHSSTFNSEATNELIAAVSYGNIWSKNNEACIASSHQVSLMPRKNWSCPEKNIRPTLKSMDEKYLASI